MKKFKITKENILLILITALSAVLNLVNLSKEGYANGYYAAAVRSMTVSFKNFFFVAFDPTGFVTIDKPPLGFWLQAISAKIFGFSGWSIILPQALAGIISVITIYFIVRKAFGSTAGLLSALFLAVTPVFVAVSRNNTIDNTLVMFLLFACLALSKAAEKGKLKYLILSMALVGVGFNVKMLQAYLVVPALYITYLLSTATSIKKRIVHLAAGTVVLIAVSLSWALIVDSIPASSRPYVDSTTNNRVMQLISGHNGTERLNLSSLFGSSKTNNGFGGGPGGRADGNMQPPSGHENNNLNAEANKNSAQENFNANSANEKGQQMQKNDQNQSSSSEAQRGSSQGGNMQPPSQGTPNIGGQNGGGPGGAPNMDGQNGGGPGAPPNMDGQNSGGTGGNPGMGGGPGGSGLQGSFGGETKAGITRLFSKNILSDQIVWFIPLAVFGFVAAAIREKLRIRLDNRRKQTLVMWFMWFLPEFVYFSYNTGLFHSYYLTMLAPPIAALAGIGLSSMWEAYKEGGWKAWFLPVALIANGATDILMLYYFISSSSFIKVVMVLVALLCFVSSLLLCVLNIMNRKKLNSETYEHEATNKNLKFSKLLVSLALAGVMITPLIGSSAALVYKINNSFPASGLELISSSSTQERKRDNTVGTNKQDNQSSNDGNTDLTTFLLKNKTENQKYLLVVSNSNEASDIIIKTGESVMSLGGFMGNNNAITLEQFKELVKKGEVRYVKAGDSRGGQSSEIMNWVKENGKLVSISGNNTSNTSQVQNNNSSSENTKENNSRGGFPGGNSDQLYDLKAYTDSAAK